MFASRSLGLVSSSWLVAASLAACGGGSAPVTGLRIAEIAFYQGVKATVMVDGAVAPAGVPIVQGRDALVRVFVRPEGAWKNRDVKGRLELQSSAGKLSVEAKTTVNGASNDGDLATTINFEIPGARLVGDFQYKVALFEGGGAPPPVGGSTEGGFFPMTGTAALKAEDVGPSIKLVLVPMRYTADSSNRLPDTSPATVDVFKNVMKAMYPVPKVEITVHEPVELSRTVSPGGTGWSQTLSQIVALRRAENPTANIYYYGLLSPASSYSSYCQGGCITGLSAGTDDPDNATLRASIGVGFDAAYAESAASTFVHEVGHAHGRGHSPGCGAGNPERGYPYRDGSIGVWGYSIVDKKLLPPSANKDFMGYCDPIWVSDFTFKALFERIAHVNWLPVGQLLTAGLAAEYRIVHVDEDGATLGDRITLDAAPTGQALAARVLDEAGTDAGGVDARFYPFNHLPGGLVLVRESEIRAHTSLTVRGRTVELRRGATPGSR